jgi:hypothetical protein
MLLVALATLLLPGMLSGGTRSATLVRPQVFRVSVVFTQKAPWTYYYQQVGRDCTTTTQGHGSDDVHIHGTVLVNYQPGFKSTSGFGIFGTHARVGMRTMTVTGAECAPSYVFPSTWSIISQTGGTVTAAEPNTGCGPKKVRPSFPTLEIVGDRLRLRWTQTSLPEFKPCPFFEGSNDAAEGKGLPGPFYLEIKAPVSLRALGNASMKRINVSGSAKAAATETCQNIQQHCPEGVTYTATGSVESKATFVFVRVKG